MAADNWPKASIGNYKGVMLCNRPNEFGQQRRPDRGSDVPFNSRVGIHEPIGWNPPTKMLPRKRRKQTTGILMRHKIFLRDLEVKKNQEREEQRAIAAIEEAKVAAFKEQA